MSNDEIPRGSWKRSRAIVGLAAAVARKELGGRLRNAVTRSADEKASSTLAMRIEQARLLAESLGRLKGAMMKAGQLLSIDSGDLIPPEVAAVLGKLQREAEPVSFASMHGVLLEELGPDKLALLEGLGEPAAASASIGQVYRASARGRPVAVKVQYPGVAESIDSDLDVLAKVGQGFVTLSGRRIDLTDLVAELRSVLHLEADYLREAAYTERFAGLLAGEPRFAVPRVIGELSTRRVLTMTWEEGVPLGDWAALPRPMAQREFLARSMLDLFCLELFAWGTVQTDPNFGNFLVREESSGEITIVLLDFGATLEFDDTFRHAYVNVLRTIRSGDAERILDEGIRFGLLDARENAATREAFVAMLRNAFEPFEPHRQPFVFRDADYAARARDVVRRFVESVRHSPPPRQLVFLHRKLGGIFQLLRRLDVAIDLRPYGDRLLAGG